MMGFSPAQVQEMSPWEFMACADGFAMMHGAKAPAEEISDERLAAMGIEGF